MEKTIIIADQAGKFTFIVDTEKMSARLESTTARLVDLNAEHVNLLAQDAIKAGISKAPYELEKISGTITTRNRDAVVFNLHSPYLTAGPVFVSLLEQPQSFYVDAEYKDETISYTKDRQEDSALKFIGIVSSGPKSITDAEREEIKNLINIYFEQLGKEVNSTAAGRYKIKETPATEEILSGGIINGQRIYISRKITGLSSEEAKTLFGMAAFNIRSSGFTPVNPFDICPYDPAHTWRHYMKQDIKALCDCEAIYMLDNWTDSEGAILEHHIAARLGLKIYYQKHIGL